MQPAATLTNETSVAHLTCPSCGSVNSRAARWRWADLPHLLRRHGARRCRDCRTRFHSHAPEPTPQSKNKHSRRFRLSSAQRRRVFELLLFLGMLLSFYVFLTYIAQEHSSGGEGASTPQSVSTPANEFS